MAATAAANGMAARLCEDLAHRLGPAKFGLWFEQTAQLHVEKDRLRITVPTRFHADWIERHFRQDLRDSTASAAGVDLPLELAVEPKAFPGLAAEAPSGAAPVAPHLPRRRRTGGSLGSRFDARFDLERFVVGVSNEMAYRAACAMADGNATFNPLFIHGGCGLGKTHLLQGICRRCRESRPDFRLRYVTGEQFTNEFIAAVRSNDLDSFRRPYRELDLLAIDDVHFLSNKKATQNEFLATFDAIGLVGSRVVLASDEHPRQIRQFHQRLVSRLLSGMVVEIQLPDIETRRQIIARWAREKGLTFHPAAVEALAERCIGSVREIEGTLTRLEALAMISDGQQAAHGTCGGEVGMVLVSRLFGEQAEDLRPNVRVESIMSTVAQRLGVEPSRLAGTSRHRDVVLARSLTAYLARKLTTRSFPEIARAMGRSNHSTIVTAAQRIERQLSADARVTLRDAEAPMSLRYLVDSLRVALTRPRSAAST
ncbi:MAG: chromosomal replication initiator protein DnaA [Phycisphaerales bacterium]|nr:chromosomal replication initiator protein DnaA [Phycisphaerales bacterium]